jgi:catechol 2,3-dioxygenase-like lactoylglutathione lyase family enzyme
MCYLLKFAKATLAVLSLAIVLHSPLAGDTLRAGRQATASGAVAPQEETSMSQSELKLNKIAVLMLGVKDLAKSTAFYRDTLGLQPQGEVPGEFAFFKAGDMMLALSVPHADPKVSPSVVGGMEVVFAVEDVTASYEALRARGVPFVREPRHATGASWSAVFTDPNGHRLSIFGPKGGNTP